MPVGSNFIITADSKPVIDSWGWQDYWGADHWIEWHKAMKLKYGKQYANQQFVKEWREGAGFGTAHLDWSWNDSTFRDYAKANGFYDGLSTGIISDVFNTGTDVVENTVDTVTTSSKMLKYLIPAVLVMAVVGVGIFFYVNSNRNIALR